MQLVSDKFYIWYNRLITALASFLAIVSFGAWVEPRLDFLHTEWGLAPAVFVITSFQVAYGILLFKRRAQNNIWSAALGSTMLFALAAVTLIHETGQFHSKLIPVWYIVILGAGILGSNVLSAFSVLVTAYYLLTVPGATSTLDADNTALIHIAGTYAACLLSYFVWKGLYKQGQVLGSQLKGDDNNEARQSEILVASISDAVIVTDQEGKINLFNPAAEKMTGWPAKEALGIDVDMVIHLQQENGKPIAESENPFKKVLSSGQQSNATAQLVSRDKKAMIVSVVTSPISEKKDEKPTGTASVIRDVSAEKAEENRRAEFISTASHEMRTPLAAIEGYLQLALNEKVSVIDVKARGFLNKALESAHRLASLFQDLLISAKAEDGRLSNHPSVLEVGNFLRGLVDGLRFSAEKKGLAIEFQVGTSNQSSQGISKTIVPLYYIYADPDRIQEIIVNLFDNAVKYTEKGKISIGLTGNDEVVQFYIKDTGAGIPKDDLPHLFQKFYRVDNSATRTVGGTGLGLFITKKIVSLYQGNIWVESEQGKGSTFYINLPRLKPEEVTNLQNQGGPSNSPVGTGSEKV